MKKPLLSAYPVTSTVLGALEDAPSQFSDLKSEIEEARDAVPENLQGGQRYETLDATASALDFADESVPDLPEEVNNITITYTENRRKGISRSVRRDNALGAMQAARDAIQNWMEQNQDDLQDEVARDGDDDVDSFMTDLETWISQAEDAEFPGAFG